MATKWTEEETELMIDLAFSYSPQEVAKRMEEQGYKRTATAIPLKYAHVTGESWPETILTVTSDNRIVEYDRNADGPDMIVVVALIIGAMIIGWWLV